MATSLSQEDINFLRLSLLLLKIAPRAVRKKFDCEFDPIQIQPFLRKNRNKIDDLTYRKIITQPQHGILYPRGSSEVKSDMFDVSLMACLLRHFSDLDIHESLPVKTIDTTAADISRIKFYRNYIVHLDSGKVTETKFSEIWNCVVEAILRLEPDLKSEVDVLMSSSLSVRRQKEMEITIQLLSQKLETIEVENNNIREIHNRTLKEWRDKNEKYISTSATPFILKTLNQNRGVIITGSPGCGKSAAAHHVALKLEKKGYDIFQCDDPSVIIKHHSKEKNQVFVIDDVCGKFAINHQKADSWEQDDDNLNRLIELCNQNYDNEKKTSKTDIKFILTCRDNIYAHMAFPKLTCFSLVQCSFSTKYKISKDEMMKIALSYLPENTVKNISNVCLYDFFPLLCTFYCEMEDQDPVFFTHPVKIIEGEIDKMKIKSQSSFICLSLLVLKNNKLCKCELRSANVDHLVKEICKDSKIESLVSIVAVETEFERLKGHYFAKSNDIYTAIHDKMFDIISAAIAPSIMNCLIEHVDIAFLENRIQLLSVGEKKLPFVIHIPPELDRIYLERQYKEAIKGKYWEVFGSVLTEIDAYRQLLLAFLKEQDKCQYISYVPQDDGSTPLFVSSSLGYVDFVQYFLVKCPNHINVKDKEGRSSFYVACENGHIAIVKHLIKFDEDINAEKADKTTALSATCFNGHTEVAELLLENNADINRINNSNENALFFACFNGNEKLVSLLINHVYITIYDDNTTFGGTRKQIPLHTAGQNEHQQMYKQYRVFCRVVNQQTDFGWTPLHIACHKGHYETVKLLLDLSSQTFNSCVYRMTKDNNGFSILHVACNSGHTEIVKLLIDVGMNINDTSNEGYTPLYVACHEGHFDTVKFLIDLNRQTLNRVDTKKKEKDGLTVLHAACSNGHTEVVKLLVDIGVNVNDRTNEGFTPLYAACHEGHNDTVTFLLYLNGQTLNSCVDTTINDDKGWSCLHAACSKGHTEIVKLLIDVGMNVNDKNNDRVTPFYLACSNDQCDTVRYLLGLNGETQETCVDTTIKHEGGWSALHAACFYGYTEVVKVLVDVGMDINETLNTGSTPLFLACENGHYETVVFLLDLNEVSNSRVDTRIKDKSGKSALHAACLKGHTEVLKLLIGVGLNINDTSCQGSTPLFYVCQNGYCDTVKFILDLNRQNLTSSLDTTISYVDLSIKSNDGSSALHTACYNGHIEVVKLLIDDGMNINDTTNVGSTPLLLACRNGYYDIVKFILDLNKQNLTSPLNSTFSYVDVSIKRNDGSSALHAACYYGHIEVVKLLIDAGMNTNDTTNKGSTPLLLACHKGHYNTVKFLLELNGKILNGRVDTRIKDIHGNSVYQAALSNKHTDVVKLLTDNGIKTAEQRHTKCVLS